MNFEIFTGTLCKELRRTASVTVECICTACRNHRLSELIHTHTCRIRKLAAVIHHNNDLTIGFDTYNRARCRIIVSLCIAIFAILYDQTPAAGNNLLFPTVQVCFCFYITNFNFGYICRSFNPIFFICVNN